ncbi:hypothetical protein TNCV_1017121 [Trichonephila clavipes]|uniref:Uncharacterized protein n=1 Tax=Trichonephila clavipes TaxID=2585209 RepID=A0A8X6VYE4_TRICX|nr:hypothetical protein TNCV_1017121 [Trichonephila clavipes]
MATALSIYTKENSDSLSVCRRCETCENYSQPASVVSCDSCLSRSKIHEWTDSFKHGRTLLDDERSGSPLTLTTEDNVKVVE